VLKYNVDFLQLLIGAEGTRLLRVQRPRWDPAGAKRRGGSPDAPRKASAWSGNQQTHLPSNQKYKVSRKYHLVCL